MHDPNRFEIEDRLLAVLIVVACVCKIILFSSCSNDIPVPSPAPVVSIDEREALTGHYNQIVANEDADGFHFQTGLNDIMREAWFLYASLILDLLQQDQVVNFCRLLDSTDMDTHYVYRPNQTLCWSRDNYIMVFWALHKLKGKDPCIDKHFARLISKIDGNGSLCGKSYWQLHHIGFFDYLQGKTNEWPFVSVINLTVSSMFVCNDNYKDTSDKILIWPMIKSLEEQGTNIIGNTAIEQCWSIDYTRIVNYYYCGEASLDGSQCSDPLAKLLIEVLN